MSKDYNVKVFIFKASFLFLCLATVFDTMLLTNLDLGMFHINIETPKLSIIIYIVVFFLITDFKYREAFSSFDKKFIYLVLLIIASGFLSAFLSPEKERAFKVLLNYVSYFICFLITVSLMRQFKEAGSFILKSFLFINLLLVISSILDFYMPAFNQFLIDHFGHWDLKHSFFEVNGKKLLRPSGLINDTNLTAFSCGISLLLIILNYEKFKNKIAVWSYIIISGYVFGMLSSRSALIMIIFGAGLFVAFQRVRFKKALTIVLVFFAVQLATPHTIIRIQQLFDTEYIKEEASAGRTMIWKAAFTAFNENKVTGLGTGVFFVKSMEYIEKSVGENKEAFDKMEKFSINPHNIFLVFFSEQGIIGGLLFVTLVLFLLVTFIKDKKYLSLTFLLCVLLVSSLSNYAPYFKYYLILCIIIYSLDKVDYTFTNNLNTERVGI